MHYKFPEIRTIADVLPAIEGRSEFIVAEREFGTVINYVVAMADTFKMEGPDDVMGAIRRECRGLIFAPDGTLMSRPFHKFFNVNEKDETQINALDMSQPHVVMEKMDGCLDENSIIITPDGEKTIKELCSTDYRGLVLAKDLKNNEICWTPVLGTEIKERSHNWYEIELENGNTIKLTGNHKVWCECIKQYKRVDELTGQENLLLLG